MSLKSDIDIDVSVDSAIRETERYYREQIFSSGCSSLVPIYRMSDSTAHVDALLQQLKGSPYIQKDTVFSEKVIKTLLEVKLYRYHDWHFFFQGDMRGEIQQFIEQECQTVTSFSTLVKHKPDQESSFWRILENDISLIMKDFSMFSGMPLDHIIKQINMIVKELNLHSSVEACLKMFHKPEWQEKIKFDMASLVCMVAVANKLGWRRSRIKSLIMVGLLKDIGYSRLTEHIDDFEVLHPLVSHKILLECNALGKEVNHIPPEVVNSILVHHEFMDKSGPLGRMRHPLVMSLLGESMDEMAQISGLCDLYLGFLKDYSPGVAFSITCGFVLGVGDVKPRYSTRIISAFSEMIQNTVFDVQKVHPEEADELIFSIVQLLRDSDVQKNMNKIIHERAASWYDRITLSLSLVRNIALHEPEHLGDDGLVAVLNLPVEFGLNY